MAPDRHTHTRHELEFIRTYLEFLLTLDRVSNVGTCPLLLTFDFLKGSGFFLVYLLISAFLVFLFPNSWNFASVGARGPRSTVFLITLRFGDLLCPKVLPALRYMFDAADRHYVEMRDVEPVAPRTAVRLSLSFPLTRIHISHRRLVLPSRSRPQLCMHSPQVYKSQVYNSSKHVASTCCNIPKNYLIPMEN